jgi:hypothetical protein
VKNNTIEDISGAPGGFGLIVNENSSNLKVVNNEITDIKFNTH